MHVSTPHLPGLHEIGGTGTWELPTDHEPITINAMLLGFGSSHQPDHRAQAHPGGVEQTSVPLRSEKCKACRWYEVRVFRETDPDDNGERRFLVHHVGASSVPGEQMRYRYRFTASAHAVVENMTSRRNDERGTEAFLAPPAARALAEAAGRDEDLEDAFINRAVS